MFERITPNATTSYEQNLVEYVGFIYFEGGSLVASASPAIQVIHTGTGEFTIECLDYLPIYTQILNNPYTVAGSPAQGMGAISAGFASTCFMSVTLIENVAPPYTSATSARCSPPQLVQNGSVYFGIETRLNGALANLGFTFKIL